MYSGKHLKEIKRNKGTSTSDINPKTDQEYSSYIYIYVYLPEYIGSHLRKQYLFSVAVCQSLEVRQACHITLGEDIISIFLCSSTHIFPALLDELSHVRKVIFSTFHNYVIEKATCSSCCSCFKAEILHKVPPCTKKHCKGKHATVILHRNR